MIFFYILVKVNQVNTYLGYQEEWGRVGEVMYEPQNPLNVLVRSCLINFFFEILSIYNSHCQFYSLRTNPLARNPGQVKRDSDK
jgi:hypothetical protein